MCNSAVYRLPRVYVALIIETPELKLKFWNDPLSKGSTKQPKYKKDISESTIN